MLGPSLAASRCGIPKPGGFYGTDRPGGKTKLPPRDRQSCAASEVQGPGAAGAQQEEARDLFRDQRQRLDTDRRVAHGAGHDEMHRAAGEVIGHLQQQREGDGAFGRHAQTEDAGAGAEGPGRCRHVQVETTVRRDGPCREEIDIAARKGQVLDPHNAVAQPARSSPL